MTSRRLSLVAIAAALLSFPGLLRADAESPAQVEAEIGRKAAAEIENAYGLAEMPDQADRARQREEMLRSILHSSLEEAQRLGYTPDEVAAVFHRELATWLWQNGDKQEE